MKFHVNWGRVSAHQLKRVLVDSDGGNSHLVNYVAGVLEHCEICRASDMAPRVPIAGTCAVSTFKEKVRVDLLFLDDIILLRDTDSTSKYS